MKRFPVAQYRACSGFFNEHWFLFRSWDVLTAFLKDLSS